MAVSIVDGRHTLNLGKPLVPRSLKMNNALWVGTIGYEISEGVLENTGDGFGANQLTQSGPLFLIDVAPIASKQLHQPFYNYQLASGNMHRCLELTPGAFIRVKASGTFSASKNDTLILAANGMLQKAPENGVLTTFSHRHCFRLKEAVTNAYWVEVEYLGWIPILVS